MSSRAKVLIASAVVIVALVGGGLWWFLRDDAPDEVSLDAAVEQVTDDTSTDTTATTDTAAGSGIDGTWTVDTETGDFDFESATGTFAGFRIDEELVGVGANTAVGRTGDVTGTFTIEGSTVTGADFEVDLTTMTTNESLRDGRMHEALETDEIPAAGFTLTEPIELGAGAADGESVAVTATGDLTLHDVTRSVDVAMEAQLVDGTVVLVGSLDGSLPDYDLEAPPSPLVASVSEDFTIELQFLLVRD